MIFESRIAGIPCQIKVINYYPYIPMRIYGSGFGDADAPEEEVLDYEVLDRKGYEAAWLVKKITEQDEERIYREFHSLTERNGFD